LTTVQSEVFEAFREIGVTGDKALKAASALSRRDEDVVSLSRDMTVLKWMMGFVLAFQVAIFVKQFIR
jgi:hypothetical protein